MQYQIIKADDIDQLEQSVQDALTHGWSLDGQLVAVPWTDRGRQQFLFLQPMVQFTADIPDHERYPMCSDQPAQIDCRMEQCHFHQNGSCTNISPAITLNWDRKFVCWSFDDGSEK